MVKIRKIVAHMAHPNLYMTRKMINPKRRFIHRQFCNPYCLCKTIPNEVLKEGIKLCTFF